ncbi:unnamed protein product [Aspergillus oryzae RIB40]|uniref:DNA, SC011 n=1 Tax=Aspergillus oryzae (strain ATCC 42149 / RIB 40) TaxID=510516 RepID=Q2TZR8_ASPOR|nr:unnamed protein product [Aspergillus oryzae RIB40]BAE65197.1 unnamed protein product [Aspergillus oryzae RIB40]
MISSVMSAKSCGLFFLKSMSVIGTASLKLFGTRDWFPSPEFACDASQSQMRSISRRKHPSAGRGCCISISLSGQVSREWIPGRIDSGFDRVIKAHPDETDSIKRSIAVICSLSKPNYYMAGFTM